MAAFFMSTADGSSPSTQAIVVDPNLQLKCIISRFNFLVISTDLMVRMLTDMSPNDSGRSRFASFVAGLGAMASIWPSRSIAFHSLHHSVAEALEADGARIGLDMLRVIEREQAKFKEGEPSIIGGSTRAKTSAA